MQQEGCEVDRGKNFLSVVLQCGYVPMGDWTGQASSLSLSSIVYFGEGGILWVETPELLRWWVLVNPKYHSLFFT